MEKKEKLSEKDKNVVNMINTLFCRIKRLEKELKEVRSGAPSGAPKNKSNLPIPKLVRNDDGTLRIEYEYSNNEHVHVTIPKIVRKDDGTLHMEYNYKNDNQEIMGCISPSIMKYNFSPKTNVD